MWTLARDATWSNSIARLVRLRDSSDWFRKVLNWGAKRYFYSVFEGWAWKRGRVASNKIRGDESAMNGNTCLFLIMTRCENDTATLYNFIYFFLVLLNVKPAISAWSKSGKAEGSVCLCFFLFIYLFIFVPFFFFSNSFYFLFLWFFLLRWNIWPGE